MTDARRAATAFGGLFLFGTAWGTTQPLTKIAVSTGHHPFGLIAWQFVIVALALGLLTLIGRHRVGREPHHFVFYLVIALIGTLLPNSFSYLSAAHLPAGIMALAIATVPMMALVIALGVGNERFALRRVAGIAAGVTAMALIALPETSLPDAAMVPWLAVALIAPFCYGLEGNYLARFAPAGLHPVPALFGACALGAVIAMPLALATGTFINPLATFGAAEQALVASSLAHAAAYAGYMWLIGFAGVVFSSQVAYVVTGTAIVFSMVFLGETYSAWVWGAVALMAAGLTLVRPVRRDQAA